MLHQLEIRLAIFSYRQLYAVPHLSFLSILPTICTLIAIKIDNGRQEHHGIARDTFFRFENQNIVIATKFIIPEYTISEHINCQTITENLHIIVDTTAYSLVMPSGRNQRYLAWNTVGFGQSPAVTIQRTRRCSRRLEKGEDCVVGRVAVLLGCLDD